MYAAWQSEPRALALASRMIRQHADTLDAFERCRQGNDVREGVDVIVYPRDDRDADPQLLSKAIEAPEIRYGKVDGYTRLLPMGLRIQGLDVVQEEICPLGRSSHHGGRHSTTCIDRSV